MSENRIFQAVLKYGVSQWCEIGLEVGLTSDQINNCTSDKPSHASKLEAIIQLILREKSVNKAERSLLTACENIPQPVIGSVLDYIQEVQLSVGISSNLLLLIISIRWDSLPLVSAARCRTT
jgi:hypothetical protein